MRQNHRKQNITSTQLNFYMQVVNKTSKMLVTHALARRDQEESLSHGEMENHQSSGGPTQEKKEPQAFPKPINVSLAVTDESKRSEEVRFMLTGLLALCFNKS